MTRRSEDESIIETWLTFACFWRLVRQVPQGREGELEGDVQVVLLHPGANDREQLLHVARVGAQLTGLLSGNFCGKNRTYGY